MELTTSHWIYQCSQWRCIASRCYMFCSCKSTCRRNRCILSLLQMDVMRVSACIHAPNAAIRRLATCLNTPKGAISWVAVYITWVIIIWLIFHQEHRIHAALPMKSRWKRQHYDVTACLWSIYRYGRHSDTIECSIFQHPWNATLKNLFMENFNSSLYQIFNYFSMF